MRLWTIFGRWSAPSVRLTRQQLTCSWDIMVSWALFLQHWVLQAVSQSTWQVCGCGPPPLFRKGSMHVIVLDAMKIPVATLTGRAGCHANILKHTGLILVGLRACVHGGEIQLRDRGDVWKVPFKSC